MPDDAPDFLAVHGEAIGRAIGFVCRRAHLNDSDAADAAQDLWVYLLKDGGKKLQRFHGRSAPLTYFVQLAKNALIDIRRRRDGHWRPSACARRLGTYGRELEMLIWRDGFTPHEAVEIAHAKRGASHNDLESLLDQLERERRSCCASRCITTPRPELRRQARFSPRQSGRPTEDYGTGISQSSIDPERLLIDSENRRASTRIIKLIKQRWSLLTSQERLVLARRFASVRRPVPRSSHELQEALGVLRSLLTTAGVQSGEALIALREAGLELQLQQLVDRKPAAIRPAYPTKGRELGSLSISPQVKARS